MEVFSIRVAECEEGTGGDASRALNAVAPGFFFSSRRRHTRCGRDWVQTCALPIFIADLESYPEWVVAARSVEILDKFGDGRARTARFVLDAGVVKDTYVLSYTWRPDGKAVSWQLASGDLQKAQDGTYELIDQPDGT